MNTEDQLQLPHLETVGADTIEFPRLDMDDLAKWASEVKAKRILDETTRLMADVTLTPESRQRLIQNVALTEVESGHLYARTFTPSGAKKALVISLKKAAKSDAQAVAIIKRLHWQRQRELADLLMSPPPAKIAEGEQSRPPVKSDTEETDSSNEL